MLLASNPGSLSWGRGKRAWYSLSAHAPKFPEILGICILSVNVNLDLTSMPKNHVFAAVQAKDACYDKSSYHKRAILTIIKKL